MQFQINQPHPLLQPFVDHYSRLRVQDLLDTPKMEKILPQLSKSIGFWSFESSRVMFRNGEENTTFPKGYIMPQTSQCKTWMHQGKIELCKIVFRPGMMRCLLPKEWNKLADQVSPITTISHYALSELHQQINQAVLFQEQCELMDEFLLMRLPAMCSQNKLLERIFQQFETSSNLNTIAFQLGLSPRHLRRYFKAQVGLSPKSYLDIVRLRQAITLILKQKGQGLTQIAYTCGFSDQGHFCRFFKAFTGCSPKQFYKYRNAFYRSNTKLCHAHLVH